MYGISETYGMAKIGTTGSARSSGVSRKMRLGPWLSAVVDEVGAEDRRDEQQADDQPPATLGEDARALRAASCVLAPWRLVLPVTCRLRQ